MPSTKAQLESLAESLSKFQPKQPVEWPVGKIANALFEEAKKEQPDSAVLNTIEPFRTGGKFVHGMYAAGVRTVVLQAAEALPQPAPAIA